MQIGKYDRDTLTELEFITFPTLRFVVNRILAAYTIEFGKFSFDQTTNVYTKYMAEEVFETIINNEEEVDTDCQLWLQHNLPGYDGPLVRKRNMDEIYVPYF